MTATATIETPSRAVDIPLEKLALSTTNPRRTFPESHIHELAGSIRTQTVLQAILVRPYIPQAENVQLTRAAREALGLKGKLQFGPGDDGVFEVVIGACRTLGSMVAGKPTIPAIVREMTDEEVMLAQRIENLRRRDLDPLDEAQGFQDLIDRGFTLKQIAESLGDEEKSIQYVSAAAKITNLIPDGKELLRRDWITKSHVVLVAPLSEEDQEKALKMCYVLNGGDEKLPLLELAQAQYGDRPDPFLRSEKWLREYVRDNFRLNLKKKAKWDLTDKDLYPEAGSCEDCPYRTGSNAALFTGLGLMDNDSECMKPDCFQEKSRRYVQIQVAQAEEINRRLQPLSVKNGYHEPKPGQKVLKQGQWLPAKKGECKSTQEGILADGEDIGQTIQFCADGDCKKHEHHWLERQTTRQPEAEQPEDDGRPGTALDAKSQEEAAERQANAIKKAERDAAIDSEIVDRVFAAEAKRMSKPDAEFLQAIIQERLESMFIEHEQLERIERVVGKDVRKSKDLTKLTQLAHLLSLPDIMGPGDRLLQDLAKRNKIELKKLRKELEQKAEAKQPAKVKPEKKSKPKAAKKSTKGKKAKK